MNQSTTPFACFSLLLLVGCDPGEPGTTESETGPEDPYIWLETVDNDEVLDWVEVENNRSIKYLEALPTFDPIFNATLDVMNSDDRIAAPDIMGKYVYNFWNDLDNVRGLWRRTTVDQYLAGEPQWETVLDLDELATNEDEDWVWNGANCLRPEYRRCLISLSRGGADAAVVREFDTTSREFVAGGFFVPEAKSQLSWIDADSIYVGSDFGDGSLTEAGYPRTVRLWQRSQNLEDAPMVFEGSVEDVRVEVSRIWDGDTPLDIAARYSSFFSSMKFVFAGNDWRQIEVPEDAVIHGVTNGQMLLEIKSDWQPAQQTFKQGSLLAIEFDAFMNSARNFQLLFEPTRSTALSADFGVTMTRNYVILNLLENVTGRLVRLSYVDGAWQSMDIDNGEFGSVMIGAASDSNNDFLFTYQSFTTPDSLFVAHDGGARVEKLQTLPAFFDASGIVVEQHFASSADGTQIPYFIVLPDGFEADGTTPTLLYGYGGFEASETPFYSASTGLGWLERGGAYVVANIRGGGEYGPAWHQAAILENRQRAYDDFIAVAETLIERGVTSPEYLGIRGASNGGLLTGVMLTQRPDLWNAVVIEVPLLDMKRYHKMLAGASWMGEFGDPDTDDWEFLQKYSPYHNIQPDTEYPLAFYTTSTRDDRVHPAHARKMVARMREYGHDLLYFENLVGGHAGASDNTQAARAEAMVYSFLWDQLQ